MKYSSLALMPLLLSGCGSDGNPTTPANEDILVSSGGSCAISDTSVSTTNTGGNITTVASTEELNCPEDLAGELNGPGISNTGSGSLTTDNVSVPITTAIFENVFSNNTESIFDLQLHNGEYRSLVRTVTSGSSTATRIDTGTYNATVLLSIELAQNGTDGGLTGGSFSVDNPDTIGNRVADVFFFIDKDGDGKPTSQEEVSEAVSGNVNISGAEPDWVVSFDLTLLNGATLTGNYTGAFHSDTIE